MPPDKRTDHERRLILLLKEAVDKLGELGCPEVNVTVPEGAPPEVKVVVPKAPAPQVTVEGAKVRVEDRKPCSYVVDITKRDGQNFIQQLTLKPVK